MSVNNDNDVQNPQSVNTPAKYVEHDLVCIVTKGGYRGFKSISRYMVVMPYGEMYNLEDIDCKGSEPFFRDDYIRILTPEDDEYEA